MRTEYANGSKVTPKKAGVFFLSLNADYSFSAETNCNTMGGKYSIKAGGITFGAMMSTMMACEGSQETEFANMLSNVGAYKFSGKGELELILGGNKGSVFFR